ncbi:MAG TPA: hypothetical protein VFW24_16045 [Acidimicrobiales bacterium]|nr:hypothetical protein [Acidimicrobiales bacterium]
MWLLRVALAGSVLAGFTAGTVLAPAPAAANTVSRAAASIVSPLPTRSIYETTASGPALYRQGRAAGRAGMQGAVILDFGRPAYQAGAYGTMGFADRFLPLADVVTGVENYVSGYFATAPSYTSFEVIVGTNNSCGTGQPCPHSGARFCGCGSQPASFYEWGRHFALAVSQASYWTTGTRSRQGFTDHVKVVAGDDAEPGFDPGYRNTYALMSGYAAVGTGLTMVDFGDAAPGPWTREQLYQVAYGLPPNVPFPEIYYRGQAGEWADLARYALSHHGKVMTFAGVLSQDPVGNTASQAYSQLVAALRPVTGQGSVRWASQIGFP